ncbi:MAG: hypothetical protein NTU54_04050 [Candidatus Omnitrophica bacterium]|nr:hypothetical protein [Candidatus Omnitrophota bacterium]
MSLCIVIYVLTVFFGLVLGFTFKGGLFLIIGIAASGFSIYSWQDTTFATIAAFLSCALSTYFFMSKDDNF